MILTACKGLFVVIKAGNCLRHTLLLQRINAGS
jgi:hypothetical protein